MFSLTVANACEVSIHYAVKAQTRERERERDVKLDSFVKLIEIEAAAIVYVNFFLMWFAANMKFGVILCFPTLFIGHQTDEDDSDNFDSLL